MTAVLVVLAAGDGGTGVASPDLDWLSEATTETGEGLEIVCVEYSVGAPAERQEPAGGEGGPAVPAVRTWDLLPWLRQPSIVHVCRPYTRAGEAAVVAAKLLGRKVVLSDFSVRSSAIGESLGLSELADGLVCRPDEEGAALGGDRRHVLATAESAWPEIRDLYLGLLAAGSRTV